MQKPPPLSNFLHPGYWPTWTGIFVLVLVAWLPFAVRIRIGQLLGMITYRFGRERRYITTVNIGICFPDLDTRQQQDLVRQSFQENGIGLIETVTGWVRKPGTFKEQTTLIGLDKLEEAQALGRGILLIGGHYSTLDFGANLLSQFHPFAVTYRPHNNRLFDAFMLRGRLSNCNGVFDRNDIRGALKHLKDGHTLWYAPDQDYGPNHAVYAPFFGRPAATITAGSRFAAFNDSPVFLVRQHRVNRTPQYEIEFIPFPDDFPGADPVQDATVVNAMLEAAIRRYPAQYMWMHKRFKTQPGGKPDSPYIDIATPNHSLSEFHYREMTEGAVLLTTLNGISDYRLDNGLRMRKYPGLIGKRFYQRHPARDFDHRAKQLRLQGIATITVDNFFRVPSRQISVATYFYPTGKALESCPEEQLDMNTLARFMARVHEAGFTWASPGPDQLVVDGHDIAILDPMAFDESGKPVATSERRDNLEMLVTVCNLEPGAAQTLYLEYARASGVPLKELQVTGNG